MVGERDHRNESREEADGGISRRKALALSGVGGLGLLSGYAGLVGAQIVRNRFDNLYEHHHGRGGRSHGRRDMNPRPRRGFDIEFSQDGLQFEEFDHVGFQPQGMAYRRGQLYISEVTDTPGTPSTIHEAKPDGSLTGGTFTLQDDSAVHISGLEWCDDYLWAIDYRANKIFKIDWEGKKTVGSFRYGGGVLSDQDVSTGTFIPIDDDDATLLLSCWKSTSAHLIDHEGAVQDGTAAGNVYQVLQNGVFTRPQGMAYREGYLYIDWGGLPGSNAITKEPCPNANEIWSGFTLSDGIVWWMYQNTSEGALQDLAYDPDGEWWYTAGEGTHNLFRAKERQMTYAPQPWNAWEVIQPSDHQLGDGDGRRHGYSRGCGHYKGANGQSPAVLDVNTGTASGGKARGIAQSPFTGMVEVWYYDDTTSPKRVYAAVSENIGDRVTLGVNTTRRNGEEQYSRWNSTDGWENTGVTRPDHPHWVKFAWYATGDAMRLSISTDGETWESAGVETARATKVKYLHIETHANSNALIGPWSVQPFPFDSR